MLGIGDIERQNGQPIGCGQDVGLGLAHRGNDVPAFRQKVPGGFETKARGTAGDENGGHEITPRV
jgi:hypothetical protein